MVDAIFEKGPRLKTFFEREFDEAYEKGRQEGELRAQIKGIKQILAIRFEVTLAAYEQPLDELPLPQLEELLLAALLAQTVSEFDAKLAELRPSK